MYVCMYVCVCVCVRMCVCVCVCVYVRLVADLQSLSVLAVAVESPFPSRPRATLHFRLLQVVSAPSEQEQAPFACGETNRPRRISYLAEATVTQSPLPSSTSSKIL